MAWKVVVDFDLCESNAICMGIVPEVFEVRDDNFLYVLQENPPDDLREKCDQAVGVPATYVQATPDLMMGDLLKNMRSSQIFSVCGLPEVMLRKARTPSHETATERKAAHWFEVELLGLDVFDPAAEVFHHFPPGGMQEVVMTLGAFRISAIALGAAAIALLTPIAPANAAVTSRSSRFLPRRPPRSR